MIKKDNIKALVLAGGESKRMKSDKAMLVYHQKPQHLYTADLLSDLGLQTFISINQHQKIKSSYQKIIDKNKDCGPLGGILTALEKYPNSTWLVMACDYPLIRPFDLQHLIYHGLKNEKDTAYFSEGLYYPSIAMYYSEILDHFQSAYKRRNFKLQDILNTAEVTKLKPLNLERFVSADTPEIASKIQAKLNNE